MTWDVVNIIDPGPGDLTLEITTDASLAPGGDRSRTGVVIAINGMIVCWQSTKQSITAISSCESEINATVTDVELGLTIRQLIEDVTGIPLPTNLYGGNVAAIRSILTEVTSWRTRHYAMRASWVRDILTKEEVELKHRKGTELVSDALTKTLDRVKLGEARRRLGLIAC